MARWHNIGKKHYFPIVHKESNGTLVVVGSGYGKTEKQALVEWKKGLKPTNWENVEGRYPYTKK
jgi:hypothetical protein